MPTDALINVNGDSVQTLEILFFTTVLMLMPSLIIMMTSFTRYVVVFSFLRNAMGTQQTPSKHGPCGYGPDFNPVHHGPNPL